MNVYLVTYWCGNCVDDYYEEKLGIFSSLEQAEMKKWDYVKSLNLKIGNGEGFYIYEFELDDTQTMYKIKE